MELKGADGEALLRLVGDLQATGLAIDSLGWRLSSKRADQTRETATIAALHKLRADADAAARALGMEVDRFQRVDIDGEPGPAPVFPGRIQMSARMAMPPPNATPEAQEISVTVSGDVLLRMPSSGRASHERRDHGR